MDTAADSHTANAAGAHTSMQYKKETAGLWSARAISFVVLLAVFKLLPGMAPATAGSLSDMSFASCIQEATGFLSFSCENAGFPYGNPSTFGLPIDILIAAVSGGLHISLLAGLRLTYGAVLLLAFAGSLRFFSRFSENAWLILLGALLFLCSPIVAMEDGYGPLRLGFALLPSYVYVNLLAIDRFSNRTTSNGELALWFLAMCVVHTFALFCDGYSFVMELLACGLLWANWILTSARPGSLLRPVTGGIAALASVLSAVLFYKAYIPEAQYAPMPLEFFRGQGIDIFMFLVPSSVTWLANVTGLHHAISGSQVYSDGPSSSIVYLGYSFIACGAASCWLLARGEFKHRRLLSSILIAAGIAMVLSLGPALKIHDIRPPEQSISFRSYLMPAGAATFELGTGWIYEHVPGVDIMRALYRWQLLVRLGMVCGAIAVLEIFVRRGRKFLALALALALVAETFPVLPDILHAGRSNALMLAAFNEGPSLDLKNSVPQGSKVVFAQMHPNASQNEYLASYLCPYANIRCYNVGGDKVADLASDTWPAPIFELINGTNIGLNARTIFQRHLADQIIVPLFDLRTQAYSWPPRSFPRDATIAKTEAVFGQYDLTRTKWFILVKPKVTTAAAGDNGSPGYSLSNMTDGEVATVEAWGPHAFTAHLREKTYLWVKTSNAPAAVSVVIGPRVLATLHNSSELLAAPIRTHADKAILNAGTSYPVYLIDRERNIKQRLGDVSVTK